MVASGRGGRQEEGGGEGGGVEGLRRSAANNTTTLIMYLFITHLYFIHLHVLIHLDVFILFIRRRRRPKAFKALRPAGRRASDLSPLYIYIYIYTYI